MSQNLHIGHWCATRKLAFCESCCRVFRANAPSCPEFDRYFIYYVFLNWSWTDVYIGDV